MTSTIKAGYLALLSCLILIFISLKLLSPPSALPATTSAELFSAHRAMEHLKVVAKEPHSVGTPEGQLVINYIVKELEQLGLAVHIQDTLISRSVGNNSTRLSRVKNIVGRLKGNNSSKAVMLMAHHDSQPNTPGAADDGSGVVSILETIRAIKAKGTLKNDLLVLITDAEEIGLMGAKAFVKFHPFLKEVGVLINLEARGNQGLSVSFEMNPENGWIAKEFAKSAPYPFANSMAYEVYKVLPNDSDFSEFRKTDVAGVNSACVEGFVHYHSMTDTPENIDLNLLQHHGSNMLGMTQHFGNLDIQTTKAPDAIFFNPIGSWLVLYPASYDVYFFLLTILLFVLVVGIGVRKKQVNLGHLFIGIGYLLVLLTISGIGAYLLQQLIVKLYPHYSAFYGNNFYNVSYYHIAFTGLACFFYCLVFSFVPSLKSLSLSLGGILMLIMSMFGLTMSLPTSTYLLYYPIIFFLLFQLAILLSNTEVENHPFRYGILQFLAIAPAICLWSATIFLLFTTFALSEVIIAPVLICCFLGILFIPIFRMLALTHRPIVLLLALIPFFVGFLGGHFTSGWTTEQPLQVHLLYAHDADNNESAWATFQKFKSDWVQQHVTADSTSFFKEIDKGRIWRSAAENTPLAAPSITILTDTLDEKGQRILDLNVQFPYLKSSIEFYLDNAKDISQVSINGFGIDNQANEEGQIHFYFFAPYREGFTLRIIGNNALQKIKTVDRAIGLPQNRLKTPLPNNMIHGPSYRSNVTLVKKSYEF
jgi:hypothetical protein